MTPYREPSHRVSSIVLAGVHAWGSCTLERATCRPLLPIAGQPLIWHILRWLRNSNITKGTVCANGDTHALRARLEAAHALGMHLTFSQDIMPRGPAGAAHDAGKSMDAEAIVVAEGTTLPTLDLGAMLRDHAASDAAITVAVVRAGHSVTENRDALRPIGVYVFSPEALRHIPAEGYQDIKETLIPRLYGHGVPVGTFDVGQEPPPRVTDAGSYMAVNAWAVEMFCSSQRQPSGYRRLNDALIHESAAVARSAQVIGPVLVGPGVEIDKAAVLVGPTSVGAACRVGADAVVSRSAVWNACRIGTGSTVDNCVLTDESHITGDLTVRDTVCIAHARTDGSFLACTMTVPDEPARQPAAKQEHPASTHWTELAPLGAPADEEKVHQ